MAFGEFSAPAFCHAGPCRIHRLRRNPASLPALRLRGTSIIARLKNAPEVACLGPTWRALDGSLISPFIGEHVWCRGFARFARPNVWSSRNRVSVVRGLDEIWPGSEARKSMTRADELAFPMTESPSQMDSGANDGEPIVLVVDDDLSLRRAISSSLRSIGLRVETFGSVAEFLDATFRPLPPALFSIYGCLAKVAWICRPNRSGRTFASQSSSSRAMATCR